MPTVRVLVVDDDATVRTMIKMVLEIRGFHVTEAAGVAQALKYISSEKFDGPVTKAPSRSPSRTTGGAWPFTE